MTMTTTNRPPEGWDAPEPTHPRWTSHDPFARPPQRPGFKCWWIARHGTWVTYVYKPEGDLT
jgi:hypothetical protein